MRGITFVLGFLATTALTATAFAADKIGVVGAANGQVTVVREGKPVNVKAGDAVFLNDVFETSSASEAQLIFVDHSTLTLTPKSKVTVDTYVYDPATKDGQLALNGAKGVFRFVGGALSKQHPVSIKTPVATIGIRGGIAETHVADNGATEAIFVYGHDLTVTNQDGKTISTTNFGTGLQLNTATGIPTNMPSAVVISHLAETAAITGIGSTTETRKLAPSETVEKNITTSSENPAGNEGTAAAPSDTKTEDGNNSAAPADGGNGSAADTGTQSASMSTPGESQQALPPVIQIANVASDVSTDKAIAAVTAAVNPPAGGAPVPPTVSGPMTPVPTPVSDGSATNHNNGGGAAPIYTHTGRYSLRDGSDSENGTTQANIDTNTNFAVGVSTIAHSSLGETGSDAFYAPSNFTGIGYQNFNSVLSPDGDTRVVEGYNTYGNAMQYYQSQMGTEYVTLVQGTSVANDLATARMNSLVANSSGGVNIPAGNVRFYSFLPNIYAAQNAASWGLFDYNTLEANLSGDYSNAPQPYGGFASGSAITGTPYFSKYGMAVDWSTGKFLGGYVKFIGATAADNQSSTMLFGDVDNTGGGQDQYLKGFAMSFLGTNAAVASPSTQTMGGVAKVGSEIYAGNGGPISGMLVDYNVQTSAAAPVANGGAQAAGLITNPNAALVSAVTQRTPGTEGGFAGGIMIKNETTPTVVFNDHVSDIVMDKNASGSVGATFNLHDTASNTLAAQFGSATGSKNAYLGDDMYAAKQGSVAYTSATGTETAGNNAAIIAGKQMSNVTYTCAACVYTHWGVWAGEKQGTDNGALNRDVFHMIPYVTGQVTPYNIIDSSPNSSVPYNGAAYANVIDNGKIKNVEGAFMSNINLGGRTVDSLYVTLPSYSLNMPAPVSIPPLGSEFTANLVGTGLSGTTHGAIFGPAGQEVGGNFNFTGSGIQGGGIYHGAK